MKARKSEYLSSWQIVFPNDASPLGTMFGGKVMATMDIIAGIVASKFCQRNVVTASTEALDFRTPVKVGELLETRARVVLAGRTSMVVKTDVFAENHITGERRHCTTAYFNMVALDDKGKPAPVPPLLIETEQEKEEFEEARTVRESARKRVMNLLDQKK